MFREYTVAHSLSVSQFVLSTHEWKANGVDGD